MTDATRPSAEFDAQTGTLQLRGHWTLANAGDVQREVSQLPEDVREVDASGVGAVIDAEVASSLIAARAFLSGAGDLFDSDFLLNIALTGGDDYELVFTAPPDQRAAVHAVARASDTPVTRLGLVEAGTGLWARSPTGIRRRLQANSFDHFT